MPNQALDMRMNLKQLEAALASPNKGLKHQTALGKPHRLIHSLNVLKIIGTPKALDLLKRASVFWLPESNKASAKKVQAIAATIK